MYNCGPLHMDEQRQDDQLEPTYSSSVPIRNVVLKTCRKQWTIEKGGKRGLGIYLLMARHDDDNDSPITGKRIIVLITFSSLLASWEIQATSFRIWTRVTVSVSYEYNLCTTSVPFSTSEVFHWKPDSVMGSSWLRKVLHQNWREKSLCAYNFVTW